MRIIMLGGMFTVIHHQYHGGDEQCQDNPDTGKGNDPEG
jgi:hypothetical protein